jgi:ubiquinone/menaquinone biosynthesis C-methylase UbiE
MEISGTLEKIIHYWDDYAPQFDEAHATEDLTKWKEVLKDLLGAETRRVLDLGTGTGFLAKMTAELGYITTGVDLSRNMLDILRTEIEQRGLTIKLVEAPVENLPFLDCSFDALITCRLVWTLVDPQVAFTEWRRVLKSGGKVINFIRIREEEDPGMLKEVYGEAIDKSLPLRNAGKGLLEKSLEQAGFIACAAIPLPRELTVKDEGLPLWYAIGGIKP